MAHALLFENLVYGYEYAGFLHVAEPVVDCRAEEFHRWAEVHVGIDEGRDVVAHLAYLAVQNPVVGTEIVFAEEFLELLGVCLYLERLHRDDEVFLVVEVFLEEIENHVSSLADV